MNGIVKFILVLIGLYIALQLAISLLGLALRLAIPIAVLCGIGYLIYAAVGGKLGGSDNKPLPR